MQELAGAPSLGSGLHLRLRARLLASAGWLRLLLGLSAGFLDFGWIYGLDLGLIWIWIWLDLDFGLILI